MFYSELILSILTATYKTVDPFNSKKCYFFWARLMLTWAQPLVVPRSHYQVRWDFNGVNMLYHFPIQENIFPQIFSLKYFLPERFFLHKTSDWVLSISFWLPSCHTDRSAESSGEMKIVVPGLSGCLFNFNPAVLASPQVVLRLRGCFFNAVGMSKWHLHFIIGKKAGKKRAYLQSTLAAECDQAAPRPSAAPTWAIHLHRLVVPFEKHLPKQRLMLCLFSILKYSHGLSYFLLTHTPRTSVSPTSKCFWVGNCGLSFSQGP